MQTSGTPDPSSTASAFVDRFALDRLPPREVWPELIAELPELAYPARLNVARVLLDDRVAAGDGARRCLLDDRTSWSYAELKDRADRIALVLRSEGVVAGNRVLLRAPNNPMLVAQWFAVLKLGAIAVTTMPLLRTRELVQVIVKARISHAICDARLEADLRTAQAQAPMLHHILIANGTGQDGLEARMATASGSFETVETAADDLALIAFTSGTTGEPKGCMHFHRDILAITDTFGRHVLQPSPDDLFCGSPPIAFTFGLGGLVIFPLRVGAATLLLESAGPEALMQAIERHRATVCFTAPTAYRAMAAMKGRYDIGSLRKGVSAGEALPLATRSLVKDCFGIDLIDGIGATELLHIFISAAGADIRPGATGKPVPGFRATILDDDGAELPPGQVGRLAVKGPVGCRYLDDRRQSIYVQHGWNVTGDTYLQDADGYFWFQARSDDMIISAGYNISGPEVEQAVLSHPAVAECAVVATPDEERTFVVKAFIVLKPGETGSDALAKSIQDHVKAEIAPYKYPRAIEFAASLPRTETGKLQRYRLRQQELERAAKP
ncbi:MAG TPA: AMP-binding protein [Aliidongia sp.]|uniref:AMP-binding protein n=1 Tax=Aliidongia sp. TaxID=1914230 RepID=UPI002DDD5E16|nr:AMP-binding protein [Aliidongia sp.]HEV2676273.1 AMP-binding protein [Aliidongia sp.]